MKENVHQVKEINAKDEEIKKLSNRLQILHKDKLALEATVASLEKEIKDLQRSNEFLKNKVK